MPYQTSKRAFTLIELLVVIAIIAILAVVVVLTLNPAELLRQGRDSNRVSDMSTLNSAINLYNTDQSGASSFSLGSSSVIYVSLPDTTISGNTTSTCASLGLPSLPTGYSYQCSSPQNYRNSNGTGWIPVNFSSISAGNPLSNLPVDPTNTSSSGLYYTYTTTGSQYTLMSLMESQKYKGSVTGDLGNGIDVVGSNVGAGPVGWWMLNEGTGTIAYDTSGNGNNGTWNGTATGTSGYYSPGNVNTWAGAFDGSTDYVAASTTIGANTPFTIAAWVFLQSSAGSNPMIFDDKSTLSFFGQAIGSYAGINIYLNFTVQTANNSPLSTNTWHFTVGTYDGSVARVYVDGTLISTSPSGSSGGFTHGIQIGNGYTAGNSFWKGYIDDVRLYNRALSAVEIQAIYNAEK